jgi:hypothetical protein
MPDHEHHEPTPAHLEHAEPASPALEMVAAALRQDAANVTLYARVLARTLREILPPDAVTVERKRTLTDRLRGGEGDVVAVWVRLGETLLTLSEENGRTAGQVSREVRGIVLSREEVGLDVWLDRLAQEITTAAASSARAQAALRRLVLGHD